MTRHRLCADGVDCALTALSVRAARESGPITALGARLDGGARSACRLQPAALGILVAFEDQTQAMQGQVLVVVIDAVQFSQQ